MASLLTVLSANEMAFLRPQIEPIRDEFRS